MTVPAVPRAETALMVNRGQKFIILPEHMNFKKFNSKIIPVNSKFTLMMHNVEEVHSGS